MNNSAWLVRSPKLTDVEPLASIATAVSPPNTTISPSHMKSAMQQANGRFWTITNQQQPIGYAHLLPLPGLPHLFELAGGIAPHFQRQGAGSFLWRQMQQDVMGTAVQQITYAVNSLDSSAARFLLHNQFTLEHEEWTMMLDNFDMATPTEYAASDQLQRVGKQTAVRSLQALYQRCFAGTRWCQPYTAAEIAATWEPDDQLYYLVEDGDALGFVWLHFPRQGQAEIEPIGIVQEKQGLGYGRFLLTNALNLLHAQGNQTASLGVWANNRAAIHLYQKVGFRYLSSSYSLTHSLT